MLPPGFAFQDQLKRIICFPVVCPENDGMARSVKSHLQPEELSFDTWLSKSGRLHNFFRNRQICLHLNTTLLPSCSILSRKATYAKIFQDFEISKKKKKYFPYFKTSSE